MAAKENLGMEQEQYNHKNVLTLFMKATTEQTRDIGRDYDLIYSELSDVIKSFQKYKESGVLDATLRAIIEKKNDTDKRSEEEEDKKENEPPNQATSPKVKRGRTKKATIQKNEEVKIKQERLSIDSVSTTESTMDLRDATTIKKENEDMPAPTKLPPRRKKIKSDPEAPPKRLPRTKKTTDAIPNDDIEILDAPIPTINLGAESDESFVDPGSARSSRKTKKANAEVVDDDSVKNTRSTRTRTLRTKTNNLEATNIDIDATVSEVRSTRTRTIKKTIQATEEANEGVGRSTRTRVIKKAAQNFETDGVEQSNNVEESVRSTRTRTIKKHLQEPQEVEINEEKQTRYKAPKKIVETPNKENNMIANSEKDDPSNSTFVKPQKNDEALNATVVLEKAAQIQKESPPELATPIGNVKDIMTDDESIEESKTPPKPRDTNTKIKEVFSPYKKTTLKKKVEAFEKLHASSSNSSHNLVKGNSSRLAATPSSNFVPAFCSTAQANKRFPALGTPSSTTVGRGLSGASNTSVQSSSAMKASQKEYRERKQREVEARKKKEAMLQKLADDKKKKNQEKQSKALEHRKQIDIERQKTLELLKKKEEKNNTLLAEREEYLQKKREEFEKKKLMQQQKLESEQKKARQDSNIKKPMYMMRNAPLLPTYDCYDSDDEDAKNKKRVHMNPLWCEDRNLREVQLLILGAGQKFKNSLFCPSATTPDLKTILCIVDEKTLKRNSSAIWKHRPRYTYLPADESRLCQSDEDLI